MRPLLKWAGGKARLSERIDHAFGEPCKGTYFEPFMGSGAVFFYRRSIGHIPRAVLSDVNPKLMEVHRCVRDDVDGVLSALGDMPKEDWRERYYEIREEYNQGPWEGLRHTARFIWLNRAGYNGLYRENRSGGFNVPVGRYTHLSIPEPARFREISKLLQGVELIASSFESILDQAGEQDQVYCDPPYVPLSNTACFTGYSKEPFRLAEQHRLALKAQEAGKRGARVVLSNHDLPVVRNELYPIADGFFHLASPKVSRAISRKASGRKPVGEVIAAIGPAPRDWLEHWAAVQHG